MNNKNKNGKGDSPRSNYSELFRNNYESIKWKVKKMNKKNNKPK